MNREGVWLILPPGFAQALGPPLSGKSSSRVGFPPCSRPPPPLLIGAFLSQVTPLLLRYLQVSSWKCLTPFSLSLPALHPG